MVSDTYATPHPRLSATVAIPTRNRGPVIEDCLRSILALDDLDLKILVIDQSTDDRTWRLVQDLAADDPRVTILRSNTVGASIARNLAAATAKSDVIAFTDDDCIVEPGWIQGLMREFEDPSVGIVYGRVVPPGFTNRNGTEVAFKEQVDRQVFSGRVPPWYIGHGASMAVRLSAFASIGGFDNCLGAGVAFAAGEDLDLSYRMLAAAWRIVYTGSAVAYHKDWRDWPTRRRTERGYGIGAGALFAKYLRCGDLYGARLWATWTWELGVRRLGAGLLKWRSVKPMYLGYCQLVYPWIGAARSLRLNVDSKRHVYMNVPAGRIGLESRPESGTPAG